MPESCKMMFERAQPCLTVPSSSCAVTATLALHVGCCQSVMDDDLIGQALCQCFLNVWRPQSPKLFLKLSSSLLNKENTVKY